MSFSDASTADYTFCVPDWYIPGTDCPTTPTVAGSGYDRALWSTSGSSCDGSNTNPKLYDCMISLETADQVKLLNSIYFYGSALGAGRTGIFAVCGVTAAGAPNAPTANAATSVGAAGFTANWTASGTGAAATGYYLDVATNNTFTSMVTNYNNKSVGNVTSYAVTGLTAGTTYYYRVRASNAAGVSVSSNTITVTTLLTPDPTGVTATFTTICNGGNTSLTAAGVDGTLYWYSGSCATTGSIGSTNPITVSPTSTTTYYARNYNNSQYSAGCASLQVTVNPKPTLAILEPIGDHIKWYNAAGTLLPKTTELVNGTVYYASQTVNGCESTARLAVTATVGTH